MEQGFSKEKIVGLIAIIVIILLIILFVNLIYSKKEIKEESLNQIINHKEHDIKATVNGDYLEYVSLNKKYVEKGVTAFYKNENVSNHVSITYYYEDKQVFGVDTSKKGTYLIRYYITNLDNTKNIAIHRAVVVK